MSEIRTAYAMVQGANSMQYRLLKLELDNDIVVKQEEVGVPELKMIVMGRLIKMLVKI